jgi:hypothetical protein
LNRKHFLSCGNESAPAKSAHWRAFRSSVAPGGYACVKEREVVVRDTPDGRDFGRNVTEIPCIQTRGARDAVVVENFTT